MVQLLRNVWLAVATVVHEGGAFVYIGVLVVIALLVRFGRKSNGR